VPFDTLVLASVAREIREMTGARVMKIYQPRNPDVVIHLRKQGIERRLLISSAPDSARVHFTESRVENPKLPPMFCMLLRKHIEGSRLAAVSQPPHERILYLDFEGRNELGIPETHTIAAEIMGRRSNIILLDGSRTILDAVKRATLDTNRAREILPGRPYIPPPSRPRTSPERLTAEALDGWLADDPSLSCEEMLVNRVMGVGPAVARHACAAGVRDTGRIASEIKTAFQGTFQADPSGPVGPAKALVYMDGSRPFDYYCFHLAQYDVLARRQYPSMSAAIDAFHRAKADEEAFKSLAHSLRAVMKRARDKAASRLESQRMDLSEGMKANEYRLFGELLTAYGAPISGTAEVRLPNYYVEGSPEIVIPLDPSLNGRQNAQAYFKKYAKAKAAREQSEKRISSTEAELSYLEQVDHTIDQARTIDDLLEVKEELASQGYVSQGTRAADRGSNGPRKTGGGTGALRPFVVKSPGGCEILVGKNNRENDIITRSAQPEDVWLHARQMPGAHVILRYPREAGRPPEGWPPEDLLGEAAALAAHFSKGRGNTKVPVDYTFARHVWKPRGAKPGMVLYDHQRTLFVKPRDPLAGVLNETANQVADPTGSTPR